MTSLDEESSAVLNGKIGEITSELKALNKETSGKPSQDGLEDDTSGGRSQKSQLSDLQVQEDGELDFELDYTEGEVDESPTKADKEELEEGEMASEDEGEVVSDDDGEAAGSEEGEVASDPDEYEEGEVKSGDEDQVVNGKEPFIEPTLAGQRPPIRERIGYPPQHPLYRGYPQHPTAALPGAPAPYAAWPAATPAVPPPPAPVVEEESAWEKALRKTKDLLKKATERKEADGGRFEEKRQHAKPREQINWEEQNRENERRHADPYFDMTEGDYYTKPPSPAGRERDQHYENNSRYERDQYDRRGKPYSSQYSSSHHAPPYDNRDGGYDQQHYSRYDRYYRGGGRGGAGPPPQQSREYYSSRGGGGARGDDWYDPWMRANPPPKKPHKPASSKSGSRSSSSSSYSRSSSSSSRASRTPPPRRTQGDGLKPNSLGEHLGMNRKVKPESTAPRPAPSDPRRQVGPHKPPPASTTAKQIGTAAKPAAPAKPHKPHRDPAKKRSRSASSRASSYSGSSSRSSSGSSSASGSGSSYTRSSYSSGSSSSGSPQRATSDDRRATAGSQRRLPFAPDNRVLSGGARRGDPREKKPSAEEPKSIVRMTLSAKKPRPSAPPSADPPAKRKPPDDRGPPAKAARPSSPVREKPSTDRPTEPKAAPKAAPKKTEAAPAAAPKKTAAARREELLKQLKAVEDAIARKRSKQK